MRLLSPALFVILLFSCDNVSSPPNDDVPKAFKETNSGSGSFGKRYGGGDIVNTMYSDLANDDAMLKSLEKDIRNLPGNISDASAPFNEYERNNSSYYSSARNHLNSIKDSALREKIRKQIDNSSNEYNRLSAKHNALLKEIDWKQVTLNDVHTYLKLVKTLSAIENYQRKNLPSTAPLENISLELDKVIQRTKDAARP